MKEALTHRELSVPTNDQATEVLQPSRSPLDRPATLVTPQFAAVMVLALLIVLAVRTDQFDPPFGQAVSKWIAVVALVGDDPFRIFPRTTTAGLGTRKGT